MLNKISNFENKLNRKFFTFLPRENMVILSLYIFFTWRVVRFSFFFDLFYVELRKCFSWVFSGIFLNILIFLNLFCLVQMYVYSTAKGSEFPLNPHVINKYLENEQSVRGRTGCLWPIPDRRSISTMRKQLDMGQHNSAILTAIRSVTQFRKCQLQLMFTHLMKQIVCAA